MYTCVWVLCCGGVTKCAWGIEVCVGGSVQVSEGVWVYGCGSVYVCAKNVCSFSCKCVCMISKLFPLRFVTVLAIVKV